MAKANETITNGRPQGWQPAQLGALTGALVGLGLAAGIWGRDVATLSQSRLLLLYPTVVAGALALTLIGAAAGALTARTHSPLVSGLTWLTAGALAIFVAGHLPYEGRTLLAWLADRRFWGLPIYAFERSAQVRMLLGAFFPVPLLVILGLAQDLRVDGIYGALTPQRRLTLRAWVLLLLPLPLLVAAGFGADQFINYPLRVAAASTGEAIRAARTYAGDLDDLARETGFNYGAIAGVRRLLGDAYTLQIGDIRLNQEQTVTVVAHFDNGAWLHCRTLVERLSFCQDGSGPYTRGFQAALEGGDAENCRGCRLEVYSTLRSQVAEQGLALGTPLTISRQAQWGPYVFMRAQGPGGALDCLFEGTDVVRLVRCGGREE